MRIKKVCDKCKKKYNQLWKNKDKLLCFNCWKKTQNIISVGKINIDKINYKKMTTKIYKE